VFNRPGIPVSVRGFEWESLLLVGKEGQVNNGSISNGYWARRRGCGTRGARGARAASRGICSPMNPSKQKSRPGTSPSRLFLAGKLKSNSVFRKPNCSSNPCVSRVGNLAANGSCSSPWPLDFCWRCSLLHCFCPARSWWSTGGNEPTGACGPPNFLCIGSVGRAARLILRHFLIASPIVHSPTSLGQPAPSAGG
jgi:hypothetical protein